VTIEGAGKDHSTKGGSRDVSAACLQAIFDKEPPLNVPYEFFLANGAKMSSSRGIGAAARNIADLLPPEVLRFLMIRTKPLTPVNFDVNEAGKIKEEWFVKLFNEFDRFQSRTIHEKNATPDEAYVYRLSEVQPEEDYYSANFQLVSALVQMPHLDVIEQITKRKGAPLTETERQHLDRRIASAKLWVEQYASEEEKTRLQETLPARAQELTAAQRAFLHRLAEVLPQTPWNDDSLQTKIFEVARLTPIDQPVAFKAIYRVLIDREQGPKAGNLLAFLEPGFVVPRFLDPALAFDTLEFWRQTATSLEDLEKWMTQQQEKIESSTWTTAMEGSVAAFDILFTLKDGKRQLKRVLVEGKSGESGVSGLIARLGQPPGASGTVA
jgi:lysyl-tRNA synthetase class 1